MKLNVQKFEENGQVLLFVVVAMTIALALGVGVSLQTLSTLSTVSQSDTAQKSTAAAEGAAERVLGLSYADIESLSTNLSGNCVSKLGSGAVWANNKCTVKFDPASSADKIPTEADITVGTFNYTHPSSTGAPLDSRYEFLILPNNAKEVKVTGFGQNPFRLCWDDAGTVDLYYTIYNNAGDAKKNYVKCRNSSGNPCAAAAGSVGSGAEAATLAAYGFDSCFNVPGSSTHIPSNPVGVRIFAMGSTTQPVRVAFVNRSGIHLRSQGYKINSVGRIQLSDDIKKSVTVYKSLPYYLPIFDFNVFGNEGIYIP
jgi:hypothetical protein